MTHLKSFLVLFILTVLLFGCSHKEQQSNTENKQLDFDILASEKTLPTNFYEISFKRETTPYFHYLVKKIVNQTNFDEAWNTFGFSGAGSSVDFNDKDVLFIGVEESGSCPYYIEKVEISTDNKSIIIPLSKTDSPCTDDATPRTFVIAIDKKLSIENVIIQNGTETLIPIE